MEIAIVHFSFGDLCFYFSLKADWICSNTTSKTYSDSYMKSYREDTFIAYLDLCIDDRKRKNYATFFERRIPVVDLSQLM